MQALEYNGNLVRHVLPVHDTQVLVNSVALGHIVGQEYIVFLEDEEVCRVHEAFVALVDYIEALDGIRAQVFWGLRKQFRVLGVPYSRRRVLRAAYMLTLVFVALYHHMMELHVVQGSMAQVLYMLVVGGRKRVLEQVCMQALVDKFQHALLAVDDKLALEHDNCFDDIDFDVCRQALVCKMVDGGSLADIRMEVGMVFVVDDNLWVHDEVVHKLVDGVLDALQGQGHDRLELQHVELSLPDEVGVLE